jgi:hypothetical protein
MKYFAYGSNMSLARLQARTPSARRLGTAILEAHDLRFHKAGKDGSGKCDVVYTGGAERVYGVLYEIDDSEMPILDEAEGLGINYGRKDITLVCSQGELVDAAMYFALKIDESLTPYSWYVRHVLVGAVEVGLPDDYVQRIAMVVAITDPDIERDRLERAIHEVD